MKAICGQGNPQASPQYSENDWTAWKKADDGAHARDASPWGRSHQSEASGVDAKQPGPGTQPGPFLEGYSWHQAGSDGFFLRDQVSLQRECTRVLPLRAKLIS